MARRKSLFAALVPTRRRRAAARPLLMGLPQLTTAAKRSSSAQRSAAKAVARAVAPKPVTRKSTTTPVTRKSPAKTDAAARKTRAVSVTPARKTTSTTVKAPKPTETARPTPAKRTSTRRPLPAKRTSTTRASPAKRTSTTRPSTRPRKPFAAPAGTGSWISTRYLGPEGNRAYFVYVPKGLSRRTSVPLLMLLHGCSQSAADFATSTRFNQLADRNGIVLVYPEQGRTHNANRCWNWFEARHQSRLLGEPAILAGIAERVVAETVRWKIDPERVYAAGLSAGGAMALVLGATYPDLFAGIGVHSAPPYKSAAGGAMALSAMAGRTMVPPASALGPARGLPPAIVFQGTIDTTVRSVNADRVTSQWLGFRAAASAGDADRDRVTRTRTTTVTTGRRESTVTRWYSARGRTCLESWRVQGLGHAWSGGLAGAAFSDARGPRATSVMWRFLSAQKLMAGPAEK